MERVDFTCNVCGNDCHGVPRDEFERETPSCMHCGSTVRMRSIVHLLSQGLYGSSISLPEFPRIWYLKGAGLSDWDGYANRLAARLPGYKNTFYHQEPFLDICNVAETAHHSLDFLISTEVFEHVPPPAERAFKGSFDLLKPGGFMVFTVPFENRDETVEHFPDLHQYGIVNLGADYLLVNRDRNGEISVRDGLIFHGGPGETLEMRVFGRGHILKLLADAGFVRVKILEESVPERGIFFDVNWSLPMIAYKPGIA